jgi:hypothetical protein
MLYKSILMELNCEDDSLHSLDDCFSKFRIGDSKKAPSKLQRSTFTNEKVDHPEMLYQSDYTIPQNDILDQRKSSENIDMVAAKLSQDTIIQQLLKNRPSMTDVDEEHELERQRRMYNMLRHSSHYKRLQVCSI